MAGCQMSTEAELLPGPATRLRTFAEGDEVTVYVEVYNNLRTPNTAVAITTRLVGEDRREGFASRETLQTPARGAAVRPRSACRRTSP